MAVNLQNINAKSVAKYVFLPGIIPRAKELGASGFGYLAFLFACVYRAVRILPATHPYVNPANIGKFGIIQVISAAADHVQVNRRNIDQIIVFLALLAAVILMFLQFAILLLAIFSGRAFAQTVSSPPFASMFVTQNPGTDIAFLMLDYVFGIPSGAAGGTTTFFGSNALVATGGPTPFQEGMHALFNFYNLAILVVAVLIFLYFVMVVVIETAQTGVPFGQRFSKLYAPFRLIAAIGLLVPLNYGFNGAQYITLYAAKLGSSFATNGWILFNENVQNPMGSPNSSLVAKPRPPAVDELLFFSSVYHACREAYFIGTPKSYMEPDRGGRRISPYLIVNGSPEDFLTFSYTDAKKEFGNTEIEVVLGEKSATEHQSYAGGVRPYCGRITISLSNDNPPNYTAGGAGGDGRGGGEGETGVRGLEQIYYIMMQALLKPSGGYKQFSAFGERAAQVHGLNSSGKSCHKSGDIGDGGTCQNDWNPQPHVFINQLNSFQTSVRVSAETAYQEYRNGLDHKLSEELKKRGWGGAGIWYNTIADINGVFTSALYATPSVRRYPEVMEEVRKQRQMNTNASGSCVMFEPNLGNDQDVDFRETSDTALINAMNGAYKYFACGSKFGQDKADTTGAAGTPGQCDIGYQTGTTGQNDMGANVFINVVSLIFGINGLFDIRCNSQIDEATGQPRVHPLAQLATVGRSLVENSIRSMGMAVGAAFGAGIAGVLSPSLGAALQSASGMFVGIATIGLTAGFILYYILPFLPFIYFFFAVGSWVKSIFEAMVGVPLWALAHLRIDGDGFSGRAAAGGYFMIFEIFLRPIFTVLGLVGGMAVFGALAVMLNELFDLVTVNITGAVPGESTSSLDVGKIESLRRGVIDQFFFTIMYTILLYMMATSSFKMIDTIPKGVMRWIGSNVSTFNDNKGDPTANLTQYTAIAGSQISPQILQGITEGAGTAGKLGGGLISEMTGANKTQ